MNYVIAKIKSREHMYEKLYSGESIFRMPSELENSVNYNPQTVLEDDEWFKIDKFSETDYMIDILGKDFRSTDYGEANKVHSENIEYIMSYQENVYFFQRILKHSILQQKRIILGETVKLDRGEKSIVINDSPDAIYISEKDSLYFKKLSMVTPIFKGIDELYREATDEETKEFLQSDFIIVSEKYGVDKVKKSNRKRIAMAMDTLKRFSKKDKQTILEYTHQYYPALKYEEKSKKFTIETEEEMKYLLWGIEQRYYTTPVTREKRVANSIVELPHSL